MKRRVVKFGGSNLRIKEDITNIVRVVNSYDIPIVVVVSAVYGVTNRILKAITEVESDSAAVSDLIEDLQKSHSEIIEHNIDDQNIKEETRGKIKQRLARLEKYLLGIHYIEGVPEFVKDMALSYGERLSSLLLESILVSKGVDCKEAIPEDIGLVTDGRFGDASVDFSVSAKNVSRALKKPLIYVVPGFYGLSAEGKVTLLGRGGSDYSAAAIARCLDASSVDIWKDVSGFMSADPKVVQNAVAIKRLTYKEAAELSYFGAKILHPRTFEPLQDNKIPIRIFNINNISDKLLPLTTIDKNSTIRKDVIKSVTYSDDIGILKLKGPGVGVKAGIVAKITNYLSEAGINIKSIITAQTTINILLSIDDLVRSYEIVKEIGLTYVEEITIHDDISLIAVVGEGMLNIPGIWARVFSAVSRRDINVFIIAAGASSVATYFILNKRNKEEAIKAVHNEFF